MSLAERGLMGAVLILVIALLRAAAGKALPRRVFGLLWWTAMLRLLLPWELPSRFSVYNLLVKSPQAVSLPPERGPAAVRLLPEVIPPAHEAWGGTASAAPAVSAWALVWLAGSLLLGGWFAASYFRCRRKFRTALPMESTAVSHWLEGRPHISVRVSDQISAPLVYGLFRSVILLPKRMDWENEAALSHILTHEYVHIRHMDGPAKLALAGTLCVHWWNPAVWLMYVLANRDLELACDETVVRLLGDPAAYARTLLSMEESRAGLYACFSQSSVEERIKVMMNKKVKRVPALLAACALLLVLSVTTAFATSARREEPQKTPGSLTEQLAASVTCENETLSFTLPAGDAEWELWIAGRILTDGMDMSVRYLEDETWEPGKTYRFQLESAPYSDLAINGIAGEEIIDLDLLPWAPRAGAELFSAQIAAEWAETLAPYLPLGLEYTFDDPDRDGNGLRMTYQGREVRGILDGDTWITEHAGNSLFDEDAGEVRAVYENGILTSLEFLSDEEQAAFTARRESAGESMVWPTGWGRVSGTFGSRRNAAAAAEDPDVDPEEITFVYVHDGIDIALERGSDVFAALNGTAAEAGYSEKLGNYVLLNHGEGLETLYAHCQELLIQAGDTVEQGQVIAKVGSTGQSTGPHLHFEVRQDGEPQNPVDYLPGGERIGVSR